VLLHHALLAELLRSPNAPLLRPLSSCAIALVNHTLSGRPQQGARAHLAAHELGELGEGHGGAVDLAHEQPLEHDRVEVALRAALQEAVQLRGSGWMGEGGQYAAIARCQRLQCPPWLVISMLRAAQAPATTYLDQQLQVHIVALGSSAVLLAVAATGLEVDTLCGFVIDADAAKGGRGASAAAAVSGGLPAQQRKHCLCTQKRVTTFEHV